MQPEISEGMDCPQCGLKAEPEQDGDLVYQSCPHCGAEFHYRRIVPEGPVCAAGLPVEAAAARLPEDGKSVFLGMPITRRPDA